MADTTGQNMEPWEKKKEGDEGFYGEKGEACGADGGPCSRCL